MNRWSALALALASPLALSLACSTTSTTEAPPALDDGLSASCNPLRTRGTCLLPFPNAIYLDADPSTKTGYRVALKKETLPVVAFTGKGLDPVRYNMHDGFSPAMPMVVVFPERIDRATLIPPDAASQAKSVQPGSPTVIVDMETKQRVAHFSEVDETAIKDGDPQAVILRPLARLAAKRRYAVAVTKAVKTVDGKAPTAPPLFRAIADGKAPAGEMAQKQAARMPEILSALQGAGVAKDDLVVAWDFVTGSDEHLTAHVLGMRDKALAEVGADGAAYTITSVEENPDPKLLRRIKGTFTAPMFLSQGDKTKADATFELDADGQPKLRGKYEVPFTIIVPKVAETKGPLPLAQFGHGLLGSGEEALGWTRILDFAQLGYVVFATDWTGLSKWEDPVTTGGSSAAGAALTDFNNMPFVTDRLQQSIVNTIVLTKTMRGRLAKDKALTVTGQDGGQAVVDASKVVYYGISLGGIMGNSFLGYSPDIEQGVLGVPGGIWSTMFQRSSNWPRFRLLIAGAYADTAEQQLLLSLVQMEFDYSDPITVAPFNIAAPLPGTKKKQLMILMSKNDSQVPNVSTEAIARTEGIPVVGDPGYEIYGVTKADGAPPSGMIVWDSKLQPFPPRTNATPEKDNGAHGAIFAYPALLEQIRVFFQDGVVKNQCSGACTP